ncbi:GTP-binding protein [Bacillus tianshenii]|nr:GTP-binding protein [Bacillus tianshenii]
MRKTEIYILGGFLGSGKTSLLTQLLQHEKELNRHVAVVMNEIGEISVDSNAVSEETPLKELLNGCVCCSLSGQFEAQLADLLSSYNLDAVYIETTGAAHPMEVYDACLSPIFANKIEMKGIYSIVDLNRWKHQEQMSIQMRRLMHEQIKHADVLLLNKMDTVNEQEQGSLLYQIQSLNPKAKTFFTTFAKVNPEQLKQSPLTEKEAHEQAPHLHIKSFVYTFSSAINRTAFEDFLRTMPDTVYRVKGYVKFTDAENIYSFQYSYGVPMLMPDLMKMPLTLVFIGEELDREKLTQQLQQLEA